MNWKNAPRLASLRIALIYLIVGGLWILLSDHALIGIVGSEAKLQQYSWLQTLKGWFYIVVTAVIVWLLIESHLRELRRSQVLLTKSEAHYRSLFMNSPIAIWDLDLSALRSEITEQCTVECAATCALGERQQDLVSRCASLLKLNDINRAGLALFEATNSAQLRQNLPSLMSIATIKSIAKVTCARSTREADVLWELPIKSLRGKNLIMLTSVVFPPGSEDNWKSVHLSLIDITERKQIISELQTHQKLLLEAERIAQAGSWEWRVGEDNVRWDMNIYRLFGLPPGESVASSEFWDLVLPEDLPTLKEKVMRAARAPGRFNQQFRIQRAGGEMRTLWLSGESFADDSTGRLRLVGWIQDVTARVGEEEERRRLEAQLRHAQKMESLGALAGGIAHDFNNILTPLYGYTELAMQELDDGHPVKEDLHHVIKAAARGKELVQQILAFSRQIEQERKPVFVHHIVKEVVKLLAATSPSNVKIESHIDSQIGAVLADPVQIHQVIMNLCINATYAMKDRGGVLSLSLQLVDEPGAADAEPPAVPLRSLCLRIADTGCGMDASTLARIFEPFFTTKPEGVGTGLGLSVTRQIIANHGGTISVASTVNVGTVFTIMLPVAQSVPIVEHSESPFRAHANERILFVDDDPEIVGMAEQMLTRLGYRVETCTRAESALELLRHDRDFALLVTDQNMPGTTGLQLGRDLMHLEISLPVILMTGDGIRLSDGIARKNGITEFMSKPFSAFELSKVVHRVLQQQEAGLLANPTQSSI